MNYILTNEILNKAIKLALRNGFRRIQNPVFENESAKYAFCYIERNAQDIVTQHCILRVDFRAGKRSFEYQVYDNPQRIQLDNGEIQYKMDCESINNPHEFVEMFVVK